MVITRTVEMHAQLVGYDFKKAQQEAELKNDFSEDFVKDLESKGISRDELPVVGNLIIHPLNPKL